MRSGEGRGQQHQQQQQQQLHLKPQAYRACLLLSMSGMAHRSGVVGVAELNDGRLVSFDLITGETIPLPDSATPPPQEDIYSEELISELAGLLRWGIVQGGGPCHMFDHIASARRRAHSGGHGKGPYEGKGQLKGAQSHQGQVSVMCKGEGKSLAEGEGDEAGEHGKSKGKGSKADGSMLWQGLLDDVRRMPQLWLVRIGPGAEVHATRAGQASRGSGGGRGALACADGDLPMVVAGQAGAADVTAAELHLRAPDAMKKAEDSDSDMESGHTVKNPSFPPSCFASEGEQEDDEDWGQDRPAQSYSSRGEGFKADGKGKTKAEGDDMEQHVSDSDLNAACGSEAIALAAQNCNESCAPKGKTCPCPCKTKGEGSQ